MWTIIYGLPITQNKLAIKITKTPHCYMTHLCRYRFKYMFKIQFYAIHPIWLKFEKTHTHTPGKYAIVSALLWCTVSFNIYIRISVCGYFVSCVFCHIRVVDCICFWNTNNRKGCIEQYALEGCISQQWIQHT